jgi:hypothetical protein
MEKAQSKPYMEEELSLIITEWGYMSGKLPKAILLRRVVERGGAITFLFCHVAILARIYSLNYV